MKLSSQLPKSSLVNGIDVVESVLIDKPKDPVVFIVQVTSKKIETLIDSGEVFVTGQIISLEPVREPADIMRALMIQARAKESRLADQPIPGLTAQDMQDFGEAFPELFPTSQHEPDHRDDDDD